MSFFKNFKNSNLIIAHRGFRSIYKENSLSSFKNSLNKCDFIEFDVQFTKDYVPIIIHDETLERVTNINTIKKYKALKPWYIKDFLYKDLDKVLAQGEKLCSLEEFLIFAKNSNIFFNLEIKDINEFHNTEKCLDIILKLINFYSCNKQVLISAFNHNYLKKVLKKDKNIALAALDEKIKRDNLIEYLKSLNVQSYNIHISLVNEMLIKSLNNENIEVLVYPINEKESIDKLFKMGVKGVFTDKPYESEDSKTKLS